MGSVVTNDVSVFFFLRFGETYKERIRERDEAFCIANSRAWYLSRPENRFQLYDGQLLIYFEPSYQRLSFIRCWECDLASYHVQNIGSYAVSCHDGMTTL